MSRYKKGLLVFLLTLIMLAPAALSAQNIELSETISVTVDGVVVSANYPATWVAEIDSSGGVFYIASSENALETTMNGDTDFASGDIAITVISPGALDAIGIASSANATAVLNSVIQVLAPSADAEAENVDAFGTRAAVAQVIDEDEGIDVLLISLAFDGGTVVAGVEPSSSEAAGVDEETEDIVDAILQSITLTLENRAPGVTSTFDVNLPTGTVALSITLPEGWVHHYIADPGALYVATSRDSLALVTGQVDPEAEFAEGEVAISIATPGILGMMQLGADADPAEAIRTFATFVGGEVQGNIQTAEAAQGVPVRIARVQGEGIPGGSAVMAGAAFDAGTLLIVVSPGTAFDNSIVTILDSIQFGNQEPAKAADPESAADLLRQWASSADGSSQYGTDSWSFAQATGEPDTETCGDHRSAWASSGSTTREYLRVSFDSPVIPTEVNIYQTFNPGAIIQIEVANSDNPDQVLPIQDSADKPGNTACPGIFTVDLSDVDEPIDMVVIHLNQELTRSWNEIDAVELVGVPAE